GRQVDPAVEERVEEATEESDVRGARRGGVVDVLVGEVDGPHAAHAADAVGHARFGGEAVDLRTEARGGRLQPVVEAGVRPDGLEHGEGGGDGERIPGEGARLVDGAGGSDHLHQVATAAEGAERETAAEDLGEGGQIRADAESLLGASGPEPKTGHYLVPDEDHAVARAELPQPLVEAG